MLACVRPPEYHVLTCTRRYPDTRTVTISQNLCAKLYLYCAAFLRNREKFQEFCNKTPLTPRRHSAPIAEPGRDAGGL